MKNEQDRYQKIGIKIKSARENVGLSQRELAEKIGFDSATSISLIESGSRKVRIEDLESIAKILSYPLAFFLDNEQKSQEADILVALRSTKNIREDDKKVIEGIIKMAQDKYGRK